VDDDGDDTSNLSSADRADREDRREAREARRWSNGGWPVAGPADQGRPDRDRADRRDGRDWNGRWDRNDRDRWDRHDRDRDRRRGDHPYWSRGRYPFSYHSDRRYRGRVWVAPPGFYVRSWSYGDYLPWGWYGPSYRLDDWMAYGLPWPPPGYDWVRVGPDVLLVDRFTGRIVQVVRMVFW
jgi:Ni/Co efflux regulator RcnB